MLAVRALVKASLLILCLLIVPLSSAAAPPMPVQEGLPHYEITLNIDFPHGTFSGTEEVTYQNTTATTLYELYFRLYPNASALYGDGELKVDAARVDDESVVTTSLGDGTCMFLPLPEPLLPGESTAVLLSFHGQAADWRHHPGGSVSTDYGIYAASRVTMTLAECYPILAFYDKGTGWEIDPVSPIGDAVTSEVASYGVTVTAAEGLSVFASGRLVSEEAIGANRRYRFVGEALRDFMIVVGDGYEIKTETTGGVTVRAGFLPGHAQAAEIALSRAKTALSLYGKLFGDYFGRELDLVEVPLAHAAGVEYPGLILIGESDCENPYDQFFTIIVSHEVAHQWWYAVVGNNVTEEPWLDEGLATYTSALFIEKEDGKEAMDELLSSWRKSYQQARSRYPELSVASPIYLFPDSSTYSAFVYSGGALLLDEIRRTIGDAAFFSALSRYYHDLAFRIAHREDLLSRFEGACDCPLGALFASYLVPVHSYQP